MKNIIFNPSLMLVIFCFLTFNSSAGSMNLKDTSRKSKSSTICFTVTEMGCKTDSKMVETALYRKKGVKNVQINEDTVTIVFNPNKVKPEALQSLIENTGTCEDPNAKVHKATLKAP